MDPSIDLRLAEQRRAAYERRATELRYARALRPRRQLPAISLRRRSATTPAAMACCPA